MLQEIPNRKELKAAKGIKAFREKRALKGTRAVNARKGRTPQKLTQEQPIMEAIQ